MMMQMSGHMLLEEYAAVKAEVASRLAALPFVAITVDGWPQKQGAEHCLAWCVAGSQETFMLDCVHTEADSVTAVYIANMFDEVISKHNLVDKACAFVTDTPSTNKAAWRLVEQRHPKAAAQRVLCIPATAAANEQVFSSFKHIWSDKRSSLLLGRMWLLAFIYFNKRVLERRPKPQPEAEWQQFAQWMQHMPVEA
ncbi:hypothetical protein QJQ45_004649 [Haematococcus lacustris]|nr:hypothetical protein QJQ45_004649 [Haematococcus lacustris]